MLVEKLGTSLQQYPPATMPELPLWQSAFGTLRPTRLQRFIIDLGGRLPRNWIGKRLSAWLRSLAQDTTTGPVDVEVLGVRMRLHLDNNSSERRLLVTPQFCDPNDLEILRTHITSDFSFVDVGANVGLYSLAVARWAGPSAKILAVEPHPVSARRLRTNVELNGFNVEVAQTAVADYDGLLELAVDSNNIGASTIRTGRRVRGNRERIMVPVCTLTGLVERRGFQSINAMKLDIEGAEERVLLSFLATAPRNLWPNLILFEPHPVAQRHRLLSMLEAHGWRLVQDRKMDHCVVQRSD